MLDRSWESPDLPDLLEDSYAYTYEPGFDSFESLDVDLSSESWRDEPPAWTPDEQQPVWSPAEQQASTAYDRFASLVAAAPSAPADRRQHSGPPLASDPPPANRIKELAVFVRHTDEFTVASSAASSTSHFRSATASK